jgi:hypothetical protein
MELDFASNILVCIAVVVFFLIGYGIVSLIGLGVMRLRDLRTGRKKLYIVGRCL